MKTFDKKDVYSWSNAEEAKQYIGACGYFADSLADLQECVSNNNIMRLFNICLEPKIDVDSVFSLAETDYQYALFLPVDKVRVEEKKWRAFESIDEFANTLGLYPVLGNEVIYRRKNNPFGIARSVITRTYVDSKSGLIRVSLGDENIGFDFLFGEFEWKDENGKWQPFGVLEE